MQFCTGKGVTRPYLFSSLAASDEPQLDRKIVSEALWRLLDSGASHFCKYTHDTRPSSPSPFSQNGRRRAGLKSNGTDLRLVGSAHPTVYQDFQRSQFAYVSAIGLKSLSRFGRGI
ncbi:MAG: hypothetical protein F6K30_22725 [Cyanothece sp. SIO2G6]|nr:hypothetical protein [Cyanothece sp. SIO2G6]